jgi:hypothetical protein
MRTIASVFAFSLLFISLGQASPAFSQEHTPDYWSVSVSREDMILLDVNPIQLGVSGAIISLVQMNADPASRGDVVVISFEFDCLNKRARVSSSAKANKYFRNVQETGGVSEWDDVPPNTQFEIYFQVACLGRASIPRGWQNVDDDLTLMAQVYYEAYLGQTY